MSLPPKPFLQEIDAASDPALAPPVPEDKGLVPHRPEVAAAKRGGRLWQFALWAVGALLSLALGVAAYDFVAGLLARNVLLGALAAVLVAAAFLATVLLGLREWVGFMRLRRLDTLREGAGVARATADLARARQVVHGLSALYATRADLAWARARFHEREAEVMDADALLALAEREFLAELDAKAQIVIEGAVRQVATVTALVPLALADVAMALVANLRMIRRIAELYGGRSGSFGSLRLLRRVFASLVAAGALALGDEMISSVAGGGVVSKLSRRFGEGVINGALTARVGLAAVELCRPLPFAALERPKVSTLVSRALAGFFQRAQR